LNGTAIICHGMSNSLAIKNAIRIAAEMVETKFNDRLATFLDKNSDVMPSE